MLCGSRMGINCIKLLLLFTLKKTITWVNTNTLMWELMGTVTWVNTNFAQEKKHQSKKYYLLFKVKRTKVKSTIYSK